MAACGKVKLPDYGLLLAYISIVRSVSILIFPYTLRFAQERRRTTRRRRLHPRTRSIKHHTTSPSTQGTGYDYLLQKTTTGLHMYLCNSSAGNMSPAFSTCSFKTRIHRRGLYPPPMPNPLSPIRRTRNLSASSRSRQNIATLQQCWEAEDSAVDVIVDPCRHTLLPPSRLVLNIAEVALGPTPTVGVATLSFGTGDAEVDHADCILLAVSGGMCGIVVAPSAGADASDFFYDSWGSVRFHANDWLTGASDDLTHTLCACI